jgi:WD40 repeat protein
MTPIDCSIHPFSVGDIKRNRMVSGIRIQELYCLSEIRRVVNLAILSDQTSVSQTRASTIFKLVVFSALAYSFLRTCGNMSIAVGSVSFTRDGTRLLLAHPDGSARMWYIPSGSLQREFRGHESMVRCAALSRNERFVATAGYDTKVILWDAATGRELMTLRGHDAYVDLVRFSSNDSELVSCAEDGSAAIWDVSSGKLLQKLDASNAVLARIVTSAVFLRDGKRILTGSLDGKVAIWDIKSGKQLCQVPFKRGVQMISVSPDGLHVAIAEEQFVTIRDGDSLDEFVQIGPVESAFIHSVAFSPDGKRIVCGCSGGTVLVYSIDGKNEQRLHAGDDTILSVAFSPDGDVIAAGCGDGICRVINARTGLAYCTIRRPKS